MVQSVLQLIRRFEICCRFRCAGMGVPTVTASRILKGQLSGQSGEETLLEMDKFPFVSLAKVWLAFVPVSDATYFTAL